MVSQNRCIFLCRIWKIEDIQIVETVPCSLFPALTDNFFSKPYVLKCWVSLGQPNLHKVYFFIKCQGQYSILLVWPLNVLLSSPVSFNKASKVSQLTLYKTVLCSAVIDSRGIYNTYSITILDKIPRILPILLI